MKIVARNINEPEKSIDISDAFSVDFGDGNEKISISVHNGVIHVRAVDGQLILEPVATNATLVKTRL